MLFVYDLITVRPEDELRRLALARYHHMVNSCRTRAGRNVLDSI